jgi:hypothetical protein
LLRLGVLGCAGVEEHTFQMGDWRQEEIERRAELLREGRSDGDYLVYLAVAKSYRFGETLQLLSPSLRVRNVEDLTLHEETDTIKAACIRRRQQRFSALVGEYVSAKGIAMCDLPSAISGQLDEQAATEMEQVFLADAIHARREEAFVENLLGLWGDEDARKAAALNVGRAHQEPVARRLRAKGISYILVAPETSGPAARSSSTTGAETRGGSPRIPLRQFQ